MREDAEHRKQEILAAFTRAKGESSKVSTAQQQHFQSTAAEALLAFETAKAEAQERDSEEHNVLKLSLEAQVRHEISSSLNHHVSAYHTALCLCKKISHTESPRNIQRASRTGIDIHDRLPLDCLSLLLNIA